MTLFYVYVSNIGCISLKSSIVLCYNVIKLTHYLLAKVFIGTILVGLIDKTQDAKVMKAIMKMVEDWVKTKVCRTEMLIKLFDIIAG